MNDRSAQFCREYLLDLDAEAAALRAGFPPREAVHAPEWLKPDSARYRAGIAFGVKREMAERAERTGISADRVLREYARIAFANIADVVELRDGLRPRDDLTREQLCAVASVKSKKGATPDFEVKMYDKLKALEILSRHLGLLEVESACEAPTARIFIGSDGSAGIDDGDEP